MIWRMKYIHDSLRLLAFPFLATLSFSACCSLKWSSSALRSRPGHAQIRPSNERLPRTCPLWKKMVKFSFNFCHQWTKSFYSVFLVMELLTCSSQLNKYISVHFCLLLLFWSKISEESLFCTTHISACDKQVKFSVLKTTCLYGMKESKAVHSLSCLQRDDDEDRPAVHSTDTTAVAHEIIQNGRELSSHLEKEKQRKTYSVSSITLYCKYSILYPFQTKKKKKKGIV